VDFEKRFRVPEHGFELCKRDPADDAGLKKKEAEDLQEAERERIAGLQERLYAEGRRALLVVVQALDAAGKDGTIKHVMSGVDPHGVSVTSFKEPSSLELAHDFLWRTQLPLPRRGMIGIYNRSHYEEVLVVRVHPEYLGGQGIDAARAQDEGFWKQRYEDIAAWERHLTRSGTRVVKLFLHISKQEQRERFLARADEAEKNWKFSAGDVAEHQHFDAYQEAYEAALRATSTADEPWYVIPADHKWLMRAAVASIVAHHLEDMDPQFPEPTEEELAAMREAVARLHEEQ
jgi:PPK2 family polyphosphate:nucleotide phosphotransferase